MSGDDLSPEPNKAPAPIGFDRELAYQFISKLNVLHEELLTVVYQRLEDVLEQIGPPIRVNDGSDDESK